MLVKRRLLHSIAATSRPTIHYNATAPHAASAIEDTSLCVRLADAGDSELQLSSRHFDAHCTQISQCLAKFPLEYRRACAREREKGRGRWGCASICAPPRCFSLLLFTGDMARDHCAVSKYIAAPLWPAKLQRFHLVVEKSIQPEVLFHGMKARFTRGAR